LLVVPLRYVRVSRCNSVHTPRQQTHSMFFAYSVQTVFSTVNRAVIDATNVLVHDMEALMQVYSVVDTSTLNIDGGSVFDNNPDNLWIAVDVDASSSGNIVNTTFVNNVNTEYVFSVALGSTLTLQGVQVTDSIGGSVLVSILAIHSKNHLLHNVCSHRPLINRTLWVRVLLRLLPWIRKSTGIVLKSRVSAVSS
jgi:hypothetical protein